MDLFRVRLNCVDHYQASPTRFDPQLRRNVATSQINNEPKVPVIRVFGSTETGQKVCAHIHGAFPYLYIDYNGKITADEGKFSHLAHMKDKADCLLVGAYIHRLHLSIDHALAVSYRRNMDDGKMRFIARITLVKGIPFYGFHVGYRYYLKIYALNPMNMTRLADLLRQGAIMKRVFQPYEAHLQFILQWMADYNLYGCGYIDFKKAYFRGPVPKFEDLDDLLHLWHDRSIPPNFLLGEAELPRVSHCSIEVDVMVQDILNRLEIKPRPLHHDFIERLNPLPPDEKLVHSMAGLWRDETRRRKAKMTNPEPGSSPFPPEVMISMSADPRSSERGGWIHEREYMDMIHNVIKEERDKSDGLNLSFDNYVKQKPFESSVNTTFQSVEDLYPENLAPILGLKFEESQVTGQDGLKDEDVEVDENRIFGVSEDHEFPYDSDEDIIREIELSQNKKGDTLDMAPTKLTDDAEAEQVINTDSRSMSDQSTANNNQIANSPLSQKEKSPSKASIYSPSAGQESSDSLFDSASTNDLREKPERGAISHSVSGSHSKSLKRSISDISSKEGYSKPQRIGKASTQTRSVMPPNLNKHYSVGHQILKSDSTQCHENFKCTGDDGSTQNIRLILSAPTTVNGLSHRRNGAKKMCNESVSHRQNLEIQSLSFPVVKDPQEPSTILRLSQGGSSQTFQKASHSQQKTVHFNATAPTSHSRLSESSHEVASPSKEQSTHLLTVLTNVRHVSKIVANKCVLAFSELPPTSSIVVSSLQPPIIYQDPYYSNEADVPDRAREWAGREFKLESLTVPYLPDFDATATSAATFGEKPPIVFDKAKDESVYGCRRRSCTLRVWKFGESPPSLKEVLHWKQDEESKKEASKSITSKSITSKELPMLKFDGNHLSQIEGPTQKNKHGFKYTQPQKTSNVQHQAQYMSLMSLEVHVNTRDNFVPNPEQDKIQCVFWCLKSEGNLSESSEVVGTNRLGIVVLSEDGKITTDITKQAPAEIQEESSELDLLIRIVEIVREHDPDILTGYEVHGGSWGYLIERARLKYEYNLCDEFSRMRSQSHGRFGKDNDKWGFNHTSTIRVTGRHMINIWRAMRSELNLLQYTMENVVFHLLHRRIPHYAWRDLTNWYTNDKLNDLAKVLDYYMSRVQLNLSILEQNELVTRTSEQARLLGVDFFSVFSRGSQYKVESLMFRIAKPENFVLVSPSRKQVGGQNALECLPLVMEPQSAFYNSPLLVLDFQSLYPSVMIAYNYCYSTFLGRIVNWRGASKMGFTEYKRQHRLLELLKDHINIAPNGMMYTKPGIRKSLLAKMLEEILETRVMVKSGMKFDASDKGLQRLLNNRQLALKLIANVTYGYTSATFSGRMPCAEIADSIVQTGRETLEKAIALIHSVKLWGAEVVYGDTDSIFVYLKGRTKDQAFDIGNEIAHRVTNMNPRPMKLKLEKVYFPCVLLAKKRYVGFKYEKRDQKEPDFDAKGIETVRRDGTPAEQKIEEKALKILFRTADLSQVKSYFQAQCRKIMTGSVSVQDFCFAREVKLGTYSDKGPPPPGALISTRRMLEDHRAEPQYGERIPYVVITGAPGARLIDRCVSPETLLDSDHHELDSEYYICKNLIPPLERIFSLVGANVRSWYDEVPKAQRVRRVHVNPKLLGEAKDLPLSKKTLESYMKSSSCLVCRDKLETDGAICPICLENGPVSLLSLRTRLMSMEKKSQAFEKVCQSCSGISWIDEVKCDSKDCPVFYSRVRERARLKAERKVVGPLMKLLEGNDDNEVLEW